LEGLLLLVVTVKRENKTAYEKEEIVENAAGINEIAGALS